MFTCGLCILNTSLCFSVIFFNEIPLVDGNVFFCSGMLVNIHMYAHTHTLTNTIKDQ